MSDPLGTGFANELHAFLAARHADTNLHEIVTGLALGLSVALAGYQGDDAQFDQMLDGLLDLVHRTAHKHRVSFAQFQAQLHVEDGGRRN